MAKRDVTALLVEGGVLRGVRFSPRGRDGWVRTGGGVWPLDSVQPVDELDAQTVSDPQESATLGETPLARVFASAHSALAVRQVVLSLPLCRLLVRVMQFPVEVREELADAVTLQMDKLSPFPGEELAVSHEILSETESTLWVFAAALPAAVFNEIGEALEVAKLQVTRTDTSGLGWFRVLWGPCHLDRPGRRVLLMNPDGGWDLMVVDQGVPVLMRGMGVLLDDLSLFRELTLSLMNAELDAGPQAIEEVLVVSKTPPDAALREGLSRVASAPVRHLVPPSEDGGVEGVALRTGEGAMLDLTPQIWRTAVYEAGIRKRVLTGVSVALAIWAVFMGILFSGPIVYNQLIERVRKASRAHFSEYKAVSDTRERVNLIQSYTDRSRSALELLRLVSVYLPSGVTLAGLTYKRDEGIRVSGDAELPTQVYAFKNAITEDPLFETVGLTGPSASKGRHKFDVDAKFKEVSQP